MKTKQFKNLNPGKYWGYDYTNSSRFSHGILFTANADANSILNYCDIDSAICGISVKKDGLTITNSVISHCKYAGIHFDGCGPKDSASFLFSERKHVFMPLDLSNLHLRRALPFFCYFLF